MGFVAKRKVAAWTAGMGHWARDIAKDSTPSAERQQYADGVELYVAASVGRVPNPFLNGVIDAVPSQTAVGIRDANYLINLAIKMQAVPEKDYEKALQMAHNQRVAKEIEHSPTADLADHLKAGGEMAWGDFLDDLGVSEELKQQALADMREAAEIPATPGLTEERFANDCRAWALEKIRISDDGSFEAEFCRGIVLATLVRDGSEHALLIDHNETSDGPLGEHSKYFMSGYISRMRTWGNPDFYTRFPFVAEEEEDMLAIMKTANGADS